MTQITDEFIIDLAVAHSNHKEKSDTGIEFEVISHERIIGFARALLAATIKPLDWEGSGTWNVADTVVGRYVVRPCLATNYDGQWLMRRPEKETSDLYPTEIEAKRAAQAYHDARILSGFNYEPGKDEGQAERALESIASYAWRADPPNASAPFTDAERFSAIKHHPAVKGRRHGTAIERPALDVDHAAKSLADMVTEWVDGGLAMNTDWRNGLPSVIKKRLERFASPAEPELLEALVMVRDADEDCKSDGLPTIPPMARAKIDAAIAKAEGRP